MDSVVVKLNKMSFSYFYDKRFIHEDGIKALYIKTK